MGGKKEKKSGKKGWEGGGGNDKTTGKRKRDLKSHTEKGVQDINVRFSTDLHSFFLPSLGKAWR